MQAMMCETPTCHLHATQMPLLLQCSCSMRTGEAQPLTAAVVMLGHEATSLLPLARGQEGILSLHQAPRAPFLGVVPVILTVACT